MFYFNRRKAVRSLGVGGATLMIQGCQFFVQPITAFCPTDPTISNPAGPLTIDVHVHVFNGSDLPVNAFFDRILMNDKPWLKPLGDILEFIAWSSAPRANEELVALHEISDSLRHCDGATVQAAFARDRGTGHLRGVTSLNRALDLAEAARVAGSTAPIPPELAQEIRSLPIEYNDYVALRAQQLTVPLLGYNFRGAIDFVLRNLQFRYVNAFQYIEEYSKSGTRKFDLLIAHLVDYDWPIANGQATLTSLPDQIKVMEQIAILTGGKIHCFAPFDPLKEVAFRLKLPHAQSSSLAIVRDAILNHGFVGVKLYPPMGFAASGNSDVKRYPASLWRQKWIPAGLQLPDIGMRLDEVLKELYSWCIAEDIPIMAHTAPTNVPSNDFKQFTDPVSWEGVPPGLRVDFGHFGDTDEIANGGIARPLAYASLMTTGNSAGHKFYADSAYFAEVLNQAPQLERNIQTLFRLTANGPGASLSDRLMYGTDWEMVIVEGSDTKDYFTNFQRIFSDIDADNSGNSAGPTCSDRFFGINAANFLGLSLSTASRTRLNRFYTLHDVPTPGWMTKVDNLQS